MFHPIYINLLNLLYIVMIDESAAKYFGECQEIHLATQGLGLVEPAANFARIRPPGAGDSIGNRAQLGLGSPSPPLIWLESDVYHRLIAGLALASLAAAPAPAQTKVAAQAKPSRAPAAAAAQPIPRATFLANMDVEFRKMDADRNAIVTRAEVERFQRAAAVLRAQARLRARFAELDSDRNGQLSLAEFGRLQGAAPAANASPLLSRFDLNRDNNISLVEYRTGTLANFDRLDVDKDGIVSAAEMKAGGIGN